MAETKCKQCGKIFFIKKSKKRLFCSWECYCDFVKNNGKALKKPKNSLKIKVQCAECGKIEYVIPSRAKKYKCCSKECIGKFNSKRYNKKIELTCPICGKKYTCKQSKISHYRTCGSLKCRKEWLSISRKGKNNSNYLSIEKLLKEQGSCPPNESSHKLYINETTYQHIVKFALNLDSITKLPKGYVIHHKDANHFNNDPKNLVVLPKTAHRLIHTIFGNVLINALHTGRLTREIFFNICNKEQGDFYKNIIDLDVTQQAVVKQGELLGHPEVDNQQPSIYRNIFEGSTTNERVLTDNTEDSNFDTSALPTKSGEDIV